VVPSFVSLVGQENLDGCIRNAIILNHILSFPSTKCACIHDELYDYYWNSWLIAICSSVSCGRCFMVLVTHTKLGKQPPDSMCPSTLLFSVRKFSKIIIHKVKKQDLAEGHFQFCRYM